MRFPFALTPKRDDAGPHYADIYARAVAAGVDLAILFTLLSDAFHALGARFFTQIDRSYFDQINAETPPAEFLTLMWQSQFLPLWLMNTFCQLTIIGVLMVTCQIFWGTTPGKWLLGIKIVRAGTVDKPKGWRFALRYLAYIPAVLPLMLGIFWISFNRERRGWHDYIAGTTVLNLRPYGWYKTKLKALYRRLRPVEQPVSEPAAEERHENGN